MPAPTARPAWLTETATTMGRDTNLSMLMDRAARAQSFKEGMNAALIGLRLILASRDSAQDAVVHSAAIFGGERSTCRVYPRRNLGPFHRCDIYVSRLPSVKGSIECFSRVE